MINLLEQRKILLSIELDFFLFAMKYVERKFFDVISFQVVISKQKRIKYKIFINYKIKNKIIDKKIFRIDYNFIKEV